MPWLLAFTLPHFSAVERVILGLLVGIGGQLDDLAISVIKRDVGIKDPFQARIVAGRFFNDDAERAAVVSEILLYRWGIADDDAVENAIGKNIRVAIERSQKPGIDVLKPDGTSARLDETSALRKIRTLLPAVTRQRSRRARQASFRSGP